MDYFARFPELAAEGTTGVRGRRLQYRYRAIIDNQRDMFAKARELDLTSHDGRWRLAALDAGAEHVLGVEARPRLTARSEKIWGNFGKRKYFLVGMRSTKDMLFIEG